MLRIEVSGTAAEDLPNGLIAHVYNTFFEHFLPLLCWVSARSLKHCALFTLQPVQVMSI